jgi:PQQ-dependent dehydrogenase (methanol/ethanol family)
MRLMPPLLTVTALVLAGIASVAAGATPPPPQNTDWTVLGNGSDVLHYSDLTQINEQTVSRLGLAWSVDIPSIDGLSGNPLIQDGIVYQSGPQGRVYANDLKSGAAVWTFDPHTKFTGNTSLAAYWSSRWNRGLALMGNSLFVASGDCHIYSLDRKTGKVLWDSMSCDPSQTYGITAAPRVGAGLVFIGNNCIDSGETRGFVDAFDAQTGKRKWRFYTVPGDPSKGFESELYRKAAATWGTDWYSKTHGCGSVWDAITYDAKLNYVYLGVGVPAPWSPGNRAKDAGDELFSGSIVALKADTGEYVWHFKQVPNDGWDMHPSMQMTPVDLPIKGKIRRVLMQAPKNGFFYLLDAKTGAFISAKDYLPQNLTLKIDPVTGRPTYNPAVQYWKKPGTAVVVSPGPLGMHNWQAMSFDPKRQLVYLPAHEIPTLMEPDPDAQVGGMLFDMYYGFRGDPKWHTQGYLIAWDPISQTQRWRVKHAMTMNGGTMATAGNLVFQGEADGHFRAYASDTGKELWSFQTKESIAAAPSTVMRDGVQYVVVPIGNGGSYAMGSYLSRINSTLQTRGPSRLLAFKLGGTATLAPFVAKVLPKPPLPPQPAELAAKGRKLFEERFCADCHGLDGASASGAVKDLRFATAETYQLYPAIVLGGLRHDKGMPGFPDITPDQLKAIQAWLVNRSWEDYNLQQGVLPPPKPIR